jgi:hypothetical protein
MGANGNPRRRSPLPQCENGAENARSAKVMQPVRPVAKNGPGACPTPYSAGAACRRRLISQSVAASGMARNGRTP